MRTLQGKMENDGNTTDVNITLLKEVADELSRSPLDNKAMFQKLSNKFKVFWTPLGAYVNKDIMRAYKENNEKRNPSGTYSDNYSANVLTICDRFNELLTHISDANRYDCALFGLMDKVDSALSNLKPDGFAKPSSPLIDGLIAGLQHFGGELRKVYISAYDKETFRGVLVSNPDADKAELTKEGRSCAKLFLTLLETVFHDFAKLKRDYASLRDVEIHSDTLFGKFFTSRGYTVAKGAKKQDGELQRSTKMKGANIIAKINEAVYEAEQNTHLKSCKPNKKHEKFSALEILRCLIGHLGDYWSVCHYYIPPNAKAPRNIYEMLHWLCGLWWNPVRNSLFLSIKQLFKKPENPSDIKDPTKYKLDAHPSIITYRNVADTLQIVCLQSENTLVAMLGHGQQEGRYAVDFHTNPDDLLYPSSGSDCWDMLVDISNRVHHQLRFLLHQCQNPRTKGGWADCQYGTYVGGSRWRCNEKQCLNQTCDQQRDQIHKQIGHQHPSCGIKSPLQSFLEDGLPGFLPHTFTKPGCKWECTLSNHRGIPCKTPMGFADISIAASLTQNGAHLKNALEQFCGKNSHLNKLCSMLTCVLRQPPQTLGDMFAFYSGFFNMWSGAGIAHKQTAFKDAVAEAIFGQEYSDLDPTTLFRSSKHSAAETSHARGDLHSLASCEGGNGALDPVGTCGPYLHPLSGDIYDMFSSSNKKVYLSWIVYLTETFYDLLSKLLEDCESKCAVPKSRCYQKSCIENCRAVLSSTESPSLNHDAQCKSIVECDYTLPNLFKYSFTFESPHKLIGGDKAATKRTCQDFCKALGKVLDKEIHLDRAFAKLIYVTIPEYLWAIRLPFFWTTVALWSLSLFYLLCVMVGRLDVLHIRSHLRIPSSHKITAQSLLAAAQVGRLAKISYLQP